ncbi:MAG: alpha/beta hydrolase-fold protein [Candidatus Cryptobacteroides sp.]
MAPEYPVITVDDNWNYSHHLDATVELLKDLQERYSIDPDRIYTTGQSMGCMSSIVMMLKEEDLFAGALLVAGKWNPGLMGPLDRQNIWIISCEGDLVRSLWNPKRPGLALCPEKKKHSLSHLTGEGKKYGKISEDDETCFLRIH